MSMCLFTAVRVSAATFAVAAASSVTPALAQSFQIVATVSPPGSSGNPANWQPVLRIGVNGSGGSTFALDSIPTTQVFDPAGIAFRSPTDLFVSNRHGNILQQGSISRFTLSASGSAANFEANFTQPGFVGGHEIAFNPRTGELFAAAVFDGIYRWTFNGSGQPVANGKFAAGVGMRGVIVDPSGYYIYTTSFSNTIRRWRINDDESVSELLPATVIPGASNLHYFALSPDNRQIYACDISSNRIYRLRLVADGSLTLEGQIVSTSPIDCAFSPDGQELYAGSHFSGGITRFTYNAQTDGWTQSGSIQTPQMGGFGTYVAPACPSDFNGDDFVDDIDFVLFAAAYEVASIPPADPVYDLSGDNFVDDIDFAIFAAAYAAFTCPE